MPQPALTPAELLLEVLSDARDNVQAVKILLAALINLRDNGPRIPADGICQHIDSYMSTRYGTCDQETLRRDVRRLRRHLMETWPDSSGDDCFPVDGYEEYFSVSADKWSNPRRLALLNWMIAQLEQEQQPSC